MQETYTEDLSKFGYREIAILKDILTLWVDSGLPADFSDDGVKPAFNISSGYVFLVNSDYQVCMPRGDSLEVWHTLPYSGEEGFILDLMEDLEASSLNPDDVEYIQQYNPHFGTTTEEITQ
jgi:hypothetical protein